MSDNAARADDLPTGNFMAGRLVSGSVCAACNHAHERIENDAHRELRWISGCPECGCTADRVAYEGRGIVSLDKFVDVVAAIHRERKPDLCPIHHLPGACVEFGNPARTDRVDESRDLRGGRMDRGFWSGLSRFLGYLGSQLVGVRRWE